MIMKDSKKGMITVTNQTHINKLIIKCKNEQHQELIALSTRSRNFNCTRHANNFHQLMEKELLEKTLILDLYSLYLFDALFCHMNFANHLIRCLK